jgi:hypothetical protein
LSLLKEAHPWQEQSIRGFERWPHRAAGWDVSPIT